MEILTGSPEPLKTFTVDRLSVQVYRSSSELATAAAAIAGNRLREALSDRPTAAVVLATGNSQIQFLETLVTAEKVDWSRIVFFHLDEYLGISTDHPASFRRYLRERVEKRVLDTRFHYIEGDALQPIDECDRYTKLLQAHSIDLCGLGIGANGHLAFNDPSVADFRDPRTVKLVKLDLENRRQQFEDGHFPSLEAVPPYAFTLTIPAIRSARNLLCLAPGQGKADTIRKLLEGKIDPSFPASILRDTPRAMLLLDVDSASGLR
jgi:glucosamine-6-phosphate deaminase